MIETNNIAQNCNFVRFDTNRDYIMDLCCFQVKLIDVWTVVNQFVTKKDKVSREYLNVRTVDQLSLVNSEFRLKPLVIDNVGLGLWWCEVRLEPVVVLNPVFIYDVQ